MVDCQQYLNLVTIHSHKLLIPNSSLVLLSYTLEVTVTMVIHLSVRRFFTHCTRQIYFFYIFFFQRYTFCLSIFLWTDTKLIVNLEFRQKFTQWKKPDSFMITRAKNISGESIGGAALINFFVPDATLIRGRRLLFWVNTKWSSVKLN